MGRRDAPETALFPATSSSLHLILFYSILFSSPLLPSFSSLLFTSPRLLSHSVLFCSILFSPVLNASHLLSFPLRAVHQLTLNHVKLMLSSMSVLSTSSATVGRSTRTGSTSASGAKMSSASLLAAQQPFGNLFVPQTLAQLEADAVDVLQVCRCVLQVCRVTVDRRGANPPSTLDPKASGGKQPRGSKSKTTPRHSFSPPPAEVTLQPQELAALSPDALRAADLILNLLLNCYDS